MNKTLNINLGGFPFTIDDDAYNHLNKYLKSIHKHFKNSEGYEEITGDIENRIAELFQEISGNRPIINFKDVKEAIRIMGTPEEFGADPISEGKAFTESEKKYHTGKRLFRNTEDEVVAGVCSGVAAYFGIQDPIWVRLLFVVITLSGGFGIPIYLIMWAILPKAETASDRLSMRGEKINFSSIGKIIEEEIDHISEKFSDLGDELSSKKKVFQRRKLMEEKPLRKGFL